MPFRRAPVISEILENEFVATYESQQLSVTAIEDGVDDRPFTYDDLVSSVFAIPDAAPETVFPYEGEQLSVIAMVENDSPVFPYEGAQAGVTALWSVLDRGFPYDTGALTHAIADPTTPVDPGTDPKGNDPDPEDPPVVPPVKNPIPFSVDVSGILCTTGFAPCVQGSVESGSTFYVRVADGGAYPTLPRVVFDTDQVLSGGVRTKVSQRLDLSTAHPIGYIAAVPSVRFYAAFNAPSGGTVACVHPDSGKWYRIDAPKASFSEHSARDAMRLSGLGFANVLRRVNGRESEFGLVSWSDLTFHDSSGTSVMSYVFGLTPRFLPGSKLKITVAGIVLEFDLQTVNGATMQAALDSVPFAASNGRLIVEDFDIMRGDFAYLGRFPRGYCETGWQWADHTDESVWRVRWSTADVYATSNYGVVGDLTMRLRLTQG